MVSHLNIFVWKWFLLIFPYKTWWKPRFPMNQRPLVEAYIANIGISLGRFEFLRFWWFFPFFKQFGFSAILGPPYCGIGATIRIGREILCLPYAFFFYFLVLFNVSTDYSTIIVLIIEVFFSFHQGFFLFFSSSLWFVRSVLLHFASVPVFCLSYLLTHLVSLPSSNSPLSSIELLSSFR